MLMPKKTTNVLDKACSKTPPTPSLLPFSFLSIKCSDRKVRSRALETPPAPFSKHTDRFKGKHPNGEHLNH